MTMVTLEAISGAVAHIRRDYGENYTIGVVASSMRGGGVFEVCASDGARFELVSDRYGNVWRACDRDGCRQEASYRPYVGAGSYLCDEHSATQEG